MVKVWTEPTDFLLPFSYRLRVLRLRGEERAVVLQFADFADWTHAGSPSPSGRRSRV